MSDSAQRVTSRVASTVTDAAQAMNEMSVHDHQESTQETKSHSHGFLWVTPHTHPVRYPILSNKPVSGRYKTKIYKVLTHYIEPDLVIDLALAPTKGENDSDYVTCSIYQPSAPEGESRKHVCRIEFDIPNPIQNEFAAAIRSISHTINTQVNKQLRKNVQFKDPLFEKESRTFLYAELIESNDGEIYSMAHTDRERIEKITDVTNHLVRPVLIFSYSCKEDNESGGRLKAKVSRMYVHKKVEHFPLAVYDQCPNIGVE